MKTDESLKTLREVAAEVNKALATDDMQPDVRAAYAVIEKALKYARTEEEAGELLQESIWSERDGLVRLSQEEINLIRDYVAVYFPDSMTKVSANVNERTSMLPEGWKWDHEKDGSGCLISPQKERFYEYDLQTREFQLSMDSKSLSYCEDLGLRAFVRYAEENVLERLEQEELEQERGKKRLFVDMDGTLAEFKQVDTLEQLYEKGYFENLQPQMAVVEAVKLIIKDNPDIEVHILSAVLSDSPYALKEKNAWLERYLPEVDMAHRLFPPCGSDKKDVIKGGVTERDFLLDDYTLNLNAWEPPARGIKLLNGINHTNGSWQKAMVPWNRMPEMLAADIAEIIRTSGNEREEERDTGHVEDGHEQDQQEFESRRHQRKGR